MFSPVLRHLAIFAMVVTSAWSAPSAADVVEYYHSTLDHYFITADAAEQAAVDSGAAGAWRRTGGNAVNCAAGGNKLGIVSFVDGN